MNEKKELKQQVNMRDRAIEELKQQLTGFRKVKTKSDRKKEVCNLIYSLLDMIYWKDAETKGFDLDELSQVVNEYKVKEEWGRIVCKPNISSSA